MNIGSYESFGGDCPVRCAANQLFKRSSTLHHQVAFRAVKATLTERLLHVRVVAARLLLLLMQVFTDRSDSDVRL